MMMKDSEMKTIKNEFITDVGTVIRNNRERVNYPQTAVASELSLSNSVLSRYETGEIEMGIGMLPVFSGLYGFSMYEYINPDYDQMLYEKFRRIVKINARRYQREDQQRGKKSRKEIGRIYEEDGREVQKYYNQRKKSVSYNQRLLRAEIGFQEEPLTEKEFIEYIKMSESNLCAVIDSSCDLLDCIMNQEKKETMRSMLADYAIKEVLITNFNEENLGSRRLYMLYKKIYDEEYERKN